jgi:hypothetical protein
MASRCGAVAVLVLSLASAGGAAALPEDPSTQFCLPQGPRDTLLHEETRKRLQLVDILARPVTGACGTAPWFLEGDFNGDGKTDIAVRARDKQSERYGIAIVHHGEWKLYGVGFLGTEAGGEGRSYRLCHVRARRGADGRDALEVTPFKQGPDVWRWTGSTYELLLESNP